MVHDHAQRLWYPALFTHGGIYGSSAGPPGPDALSQHAVVILNNPLKNKDLLAQVCTKGYASLSGFEVLGLWLI